MVLLCPKGREKPSSCQASEDSLQNRSKETFISKTFLRKPSKRAASHSHEFLSPNSTRPHQECGPLFLPSFRLCLLFLLTPVVQGQIGPCPFNMMCTCKYDIPWLKEQTNSAPQFGGGRYTDPSMLSGYAHSLLMDLLCVGVPFARIPDPTRTNRGGSTPAKALPDGVILQMDVINSGLEVIKDHDFAETRVENLRLMSNRLRRIEDETFKEMSHSLKTLDLSDNELSSVPRRAMSYLKILEYLSLQGNNIPDLRPEDWRDMPETISTIILSNNDIDAVPRNVFGDFRRLLWLNLESNNIVRLESGCFPPNIQTLSLDHNLLSIFPTEAIHSIKNLSWLLLRGNLLDRLPETAIPVPRTLNKLDLGENFIRFLPDNIFNGTLSVQDLHLDFNIMTEIQDEAFKGLNPGRLYLSSNEIKNLSEKAFLGGPQDSIVMLDLDKNLLEEVPTAIKHLKKLKYLYIPNNKIRNVSDDAFRSFCDKLEALSLYGNQLTEIPRDALENCTLTHINLGHNLIEKISEEDFETWGDDLETLILRNNRLQTIPPHAFRNTPKLNELSLSFNRIIDVSQESFIDVLNTLEILEISFGIYRDDFPEEVLKPLTSLKWIALDNNNFRTISETALYSFGKLGYFNMDFNRLNHIPKTLFHQNVHKNLADIRLAYNFISTLNPHTFHKLDSLRTVVLNGNEMKAVKFDAFRTLPNLVTILLSDNQIHEIQDKAFSDLPNLMELDLQKNQLKSFSLAVFENSTNQLFPLSLNLSYNELTTLQPYVGSKIHIKNLDLNHNRLKQVPINFIQVFTYSLQKLDLGYNRITNLDSRAFGDLNNLQVLTLQHNNIDKIRPRVFAGLPSVQILDLSHNHMKSLPHECFSDIHSLRFVDLSHSHLRSLPKSAFTNTLVETLKMAHNEFVSMPTAGLAAIANSLHYLDMSYNHLEHLDSTMFDKFSNLFDLNLAHNKLTILPDNVFESLYSLLNLDLSANHVTANFKELFHYTQKIQTLNLAHIGFTSTPIIPLPNLISLNLSHNFITDIETQSIERLSIIRQLDLSYNKVSNVHSRIWTYMPYLKWLDLSHNPIKSLTKDSFIGASRMETLMLRGLDQIARFDYDALSHMSFLKELYMNTFPDIEKYRFRVGHLLATIHTLQKLHLEIRENALTDQLSGAFGPKLKELYITGEKLKAIESKTFQNYNNKHKLLLSITDTSVESLPDGLFSPLAEVAYLSLDLRRNKLRYLSNHVLYDNGSGWENKGTTFVAGGLALQGNDWTCDCSLLWLGNWLRRWLRETLQIHTTKLKVAQQVHRLAREATCHDLETGQQIPLLDLRFEDLSCQVSPLSSSGISRVSNISPILLQLATLLPTFGSLCLLQGGDLYRRILHITSLWAALNLIFIFAQIS